MFHLESSPPRLAGFLLATSETNGLHFQIVRSDVATFIVSLFSFEQRGTLSASIA